MKARFLSTAVSALAVMFLPHMLFSQARDFQAERVIVDDNAGDGTLNRMFIQTSATLGQDVILTIPDLGLAAAQFLLAPSGTPGVWFLNGNSGTTAGTHYLGTSDAVALHLYVNGGTDNAMVLNTNGSVQRSTTGDPRGNNAVDMQLTRTNAAQVASGLNATIGGGRQSTASGDQSTVGGGIQHLASGAYSTIAGGNRDTASGIESTVGGGIGNVASHSRATIGGGGGNRASGELTVIGGGRQNLASGYGSTIGGGEGDTASAFYATISGGFQNNASGGRSAIGGGEFNAAGGTNSAIPGGRGMTLTAAANRSFGFLGGNTGSNDMIISDPNIAVFGNTDLWLANNDNGASQIRFYEAYNTAGAFPNTAHYTAFAAGTQASNITYTLPTAAPAADGAFLSSTTGGVMSWTTNLSGSSLLLNGATTVTNSRIVINEGHWTTQGTAPAAAGDGTNLAAGVTVATSSTDVAGKVTATDGGNIGSGVITVTFNNAYASNPVVVVVPANASTANASFYVSNETTTSFDINVGTTSGNGVDTYVFNYHVIETD